MSSILDDKLDFETFATYLAILATAGAAAWIAKMWAEDWW